MNNNILALVFLVAGALLTIGTTTIMVPAAYAGGDDHDDDDNGDGNKVKVEDQSVGTIADCDDNDNSGTFSCFPSTAFSISNFPPP
jgi:hypothetical protein